MPALTPVRPLFVAAAVALPLLLAACQTPPPPPAPAPPAAQTPPPPPRVLPVEAEPAAPATRLPSTAMPLAPGSLPGMLAYAERVRSLGPQDLSAEIGRLGDAGDSPIAQMQLALALAQTRTPADLARALGLLQKVAANPSSEAQVLHPLARTLAARYQEQRRVEDDRDRQAQQLRDSQRRIDQLNDRIEALRAIERSFAPRSAPAPGTNGHKAPASP